MIPGVVVGGTRPPKDSLPGSLPLAVTDLIIAC